MSEPRFIDADPVFSSERFCLAIERFATTVGQVSRPVIHHPGAVAIIAQPQPDTVLLVRQYRYPLRRWTLEIPAGTCQAGEDPLLTAQRELAEEAGRAAGEWREWFRFFPASGVSDEEMIVYQAQDLHSVNGTPDYGELIAAEEVSLSELPRLRAAGLISDGKTLLGLSLLSAAPQALISGNHSGAGAC